MSKTQFSKEKALKSATVSNQIEGYAPVKDKEVLKKVTKLTCRLVVYPVPPTLSIQSIINHRGFITNKGR